MGWMADHEMMWQEPDPEELASMSYDADFIALIDKYLQGDISWRTASGNTMFISELSDEHLANIINMLKRDKVNVCLNWHELLSVMKIEVYVRDRIKRSHCSPKQ